MAPGAQTLVEDYNRIRAKSQNSGESAAGWCRGLGNEGCNHVKVDGE